MAEKITFSFGKTEEKKSRIKELIVIFIKSLQWWLYERNKRRRYWFKWMTYDGPTKRKP